MSMRVATFKVKIPHSLTLILNKGSVVDFQHANGAIVNAANDGCLGGGGVDGAISKAGGDELFQDRLALPIVTSYRTSNELGKFVLRQVRCPVGESKRTGPSQYGTLGVPYVIHSVGPNYWDYDDHIDEADQLLGSAYTQSLQRAEEVQLESIAFSLLSAGVFKGRRSLKDVLRIGIESICKFEGYGHLKEVHLFGFNVNEVKTLLKIISDHSDIFQEVKEVEKDTDDEAKKGSTDS